MENTQSFSAIVKARVEARRQRMRELVAQKQDAIRALRKDSAKTVKQKVDALKTIQTTFKAGIEKLREDFKPAVPKPGIAKEIKTMPIGKPIELKEKEKGIAIKTSMSRGGGKRKAAAKTIRKKGSVC